MEQSVYIVYTHFGLNTGIVYFYEKCLKVCLNVEEEKYRRTVVKKLDYT